MTRNEKSLQALFSGKRIIKSSTGTIQCVYVSDIPVSSWNKELALSAIKNNVTNYGYYEYNGRKGCCIVGDFDDIYNFIESNGYTVDEDYIYHWKEFNWDSAKKLDKQYTGQDYWNRKGIGNSRRPIKSSPYLFEEIDDIRYGKQPGLRQSDFDDIMFEVINELNLKRHFRVERPSWKWWNFSSKGMDVSFSVNIDKDCDNGNGGMYADVLGFGNGFDTSINGSDTFKYKTKFIPNIVDKSPDEFKKDLIDTVNDCLSYIKSKKNLFVKWR